MYNERGDARECEMVIKKEGKKVQYETIVV